MDKKENKRPVSNFEKESKISEILEAFKISERKQAKAAKRKNRR